MESSRRRERGGCQVENLHEVGRASAFRERKRMAPSGFVQKPKMHRQHLTTTPSPGVD